MKETAEAAPKHTGYARQHNRCPSPLALYESKFCKVCADCEYCNANTQRRLICILCAMLDAQLRNNELAKLRGAHL